MKLLIVDDSAQMRREIKDLVTGIADETYECTDGLQVLAAYANCRPDWVLMDIVMQQQDGLETTRRLMSLYPDAKIAILTNYDDDYLRDAASAAGARHYFLKDNLLDVRRLLFGRTTRADDVASVDSIED